jgi:predicted amidophosphoribosyltransferase
LERQIPQKPREHYHWGDFTKEEKLENNQWFCGKCDWQIGEEDNYCNECGQRVDWS